MSCHRSNQILNVIMNRARAIVVSVKNNIKKKKKEKDALLHSQNPLVTNSQTVHSLDTPRKRAYCVQVLPRT